MLLLECALEIPHNVGEKENNARGIMIKNRYVICSWPFYLWLKNVHGFLVKPSAAQRAPQENIILQKQTNIALRQSNS